MGRDKRTPVLGRLRSQGQRKAAVMRRRRWQEGRREMVERKVRKLQRIVPGGEGLQPDRLFLLTADYILHLRLQLNLLRSISKLYSPSPF